jgi:hypothetical protein
LLRSPGIFSRRACVFEPRFFSVDPVLAFVSTLLR